MAVTRVVEVITPNSVVGESSGKTVVIEVVRTTQAPINTDAGKAVVEVASRPVVANAVVSATPPPFPFENMIWIDISG